MLLPLVRGASLQGAAGHVRICPTARALSRQGIRLRRYPEPRAGHLLRRVARRGVAEQLYEQFVGGIDAFGVVEGVEIQQEPAYHGERERC
jgi:hypothetical protein